MLKQIGTYLIAREIETSEKRKTKKFAIENKDNGTRLGIIKWYPAWRQFCFFPSNDIVFSSGCISDIQNFMIDLNEQHSHKLKEIEKQDDDFDNGYYPSSTPSFFF